MAEEGGGSFVASESGAGGGAGGVGQDGQANGAVAQGGPGVASAISGNLVVYAKGGNAGGVNSALIAGAANTGNGGGGGDGNALVGPSGGSGVIIVRYRTS
jgi:hypothetical protein